MEPPALTAHLALTEPALRADMEEVRVAMEPIMAGVEAEEAQAWVERSSSAARLQLKTISAQRAFHPILSLRDPGAPA